MIADATRNPLLDYPLMQNPALDGMIPASDQPIQPLQQAQQQQGQLQSIGAHTSRPAPSAAPLAHFQPNAQRQQREQSLQQGIDHLSNRPPAQGFFGKAGRVLEGIGNAAGTIFLGNNVMSGIPGTNQSNALKQQSGIRELQDLEGQDTADKQAFDKQQEFASKQPLQEAQTREANARADDLENPQPEPLQHIETDQGIFALNPRTKELTPLTYQGKPLMKPTVMPKEVNAKEQVQRQLIEAENNGDAATVKKLQQQLKDMDPMGQQRIGLTIRGQDLAGERSGDKQDTQTKQAAYKAFQPALDSGERFNVMAKNYEDAIKNHDQQAMLSLLANHLGMTMGLQKGARLTKDIIHEAEQSRPWLQGLAAKFDQNGVLSGVTLTPEQMRQMVDLGRGRFNEDTVKARSESRYLGAQDDGPDRTPSKSTINFYLGQANGDVAKAKQLATEDGWTVK